MSKFSLNFIFLCLTLSVASCGKEMVDVKSQQSHLAQNDNSRIFSIKYQHSALTSQTIIPRNATFKIPEQFAFTSDFDLNQEFEIIYNFNPDNFHYEFKCFYRPVNLNDQFVLNRCLDFNGNNLGDVVDVDFMMDAGKAILLRSAETFQFNFTIDYQVEWK